MVNMYSMTRRESEVGTFEKLKPFIITAVAAAVIALVGYRLLIIKQAPYEQLPSSEEQTLDSLLSADELPKDEGGDNIVDAASPNTDKGQVSTVFVDVKGAVNKPGVYEMQSGQRVVDAVQVSGGTVEQAEVKAVNFAQLLYDEMVIYIPYEGEEADLPLFEISPYGEETDKGKININTAGVGELLELNGIGPQKAEAIVIYREEQGPFEKPEDIVNVSGIGEKTFEKIQDQIIVH